MPRTILEPRFQVEYLSILDSDGKLDTSLEPEIPAADLKRLYRGMLIGRRLDERMIRLQRQGRIGTFAPIKGQEASQVGAVSTLRPTDWVVPSFRETAAMLWRGWPLEKPLMPYAGFLEGGQPEPGQNDLPVTIPVATQLPHAVGLAYAAQYRGDDAVVMAFCGDGATSEGDFHEALNFAGVWHVPVVFLVQNNQWAISVPLKKQTHSKTIAQKALAYGLPGLQVDGNDVLAVYSACQEAVARARAGDGPTLVECVTYRLGVHTTADDPTKYRSTEEGSVGAQGSAHALRKPHAEEEAPGRRAGRIDRRRDRRGREALRGARHARSAHDVRARVRDAAAAPRGPARRAGRPTAQRRRPRRRARY
jgi:pyruvate dehydrogenase E1 component alpha subunit